MSESLRCFVALPVATKARRALAAACVPLREGPWSDAVRWTPPDQYHLTLRFLGEVPRATIPALGRLLDELARGAEPIPLALSRITGFPSPARARVLVGAVDAPPSLGALVADLAAGLAALGPPFDDAPARRRFRAHVTIGRVRRPPLRARVGASLSPSPFFARELLLMRSRLAPGGARYEALHRATLD